jgi:mitogen-activated protein kinase kinase 1
MGEGSNHSWELSDSGNLKDRNMAINDLGVSIVTSDASSFVGLDGVASSDGDGILSVQSCESRTQTFPAQASDFVVLETIGTGSSSYVRKVIRKRDNRIMALKCINVCDPSLRDSIISEIRMQIANMKSKHVVQFHAAFYSEGVIAIVLDLASAGSLGDIVRLRSRLPENSPAIPEPILAFMMEQVLMGLRFIHKQQHQVHRDFKPSNLLLDHSGRVLLSDFGTATSLDSSAAFCGRFFFPFNCATLIYFAPTGSFVGTYLYMSPERFQAEKFSFPSDIWSLGLVVLECYLGSFPIVGSKNGYVAAAHPFTPLYANSHGKSV